MIRVILAALCLCSSLQASFDDFSRRYPSPNLFELHQKEEPSTAAEAGPPGLPPLSLAVWGTPYLRLTNSPFGIAAGAGLELGVQLSPSLSIAIGTSVWTNFVDAQEEDGEYVEEDAFGYELELGLRWRLARWRSGSIYGDLRSTLALFEGPGPIRSTYSLGGGLHLGFEFGGSYIRGYIEGGVEWRAALNYHEVGWLNAGDRNGAGGVHVDLLRIGLRVFF